MIDSYDIPSEFFTEWIDKYNVTILLLIGDDLLFKQSVYTKPKVISIIDG
jgi:hypothetical protein